MATISRNLAELRREGLETVSTSSTISLFRNSSLPRRIVEQEPVIQVTFTLRITTFFSWHKPFSVLILICGLAVNCRHNASFDSRSEYSIIRGE